MVGSETDPQDCGYDENKAIFACKRDSRGKTYVDEKYYCVTTAKTKEIQNLANNVVMLISNFSPQ